MLLLLIGLFDIHHSFILFFVSFTRAATLLSEVYRLLETVGSARDIFCRHFIDCSLKHLVAFSLLLCSCLIARNLLNGLKTCQEIFQYMNCSENKLICQGGDAANYLGEGYPKFDSNGNVVGIFPLIALVC